MENCEGGIATNIEIDVKDQRIFLDAINNNDLETVRFLLFEKKLSPNFQLNKRSPICEAVCKGAEEMVDMLIEAKCSLDTVNIQDPLWHRRPIHLAASEGHTNIINKLLDHGIHVNCSDNDERTPLHWSAIYGQAKAAKLLVSRGAAVNIAKVDGFTPLHAAACLDHSSVCRVLLKNGAEINKCDNDGWNVLHTAVCYNHILVVKTLLESGVDVNYRAVTSDGNTYLHIAASSGHLAVGMLLVDFGFALNEKNDLGCTPFHLAMLNGQHKFCKFLAQMNADIQTHNKSGQTPLYLTAVRTDENFIQLLIQSGYDFTKETWAREKDFPFGLQQNTKLGEIVQYYATNVRSLKHLCVFKVRKVLGRNLLRNAHDLPIPLILKDSLLFKDT